MTPASRLTENRWFFGYFLSGVIIAAIMFAGFAKHFYLRAWIGTRPITAMVHVHGLVMTAWILLFLTQAPLIAKRRTDLHRKLGIAGAFLAVVVVALGIYTISNSILRHNPDANPQSFALLYVAFDGLSLLLFGGFLSSVADRTPRRSSRRSLLPARPTSSTGATSTWNSAALMWSRSRTCGCATAARSSWPRIRVRARRWCSTRMHGRSSSLAACRAEVSTTT